MLFIIAALLPNVSVAKSRQADSALINFFNNVKTLSADFKQVVLDEELVMIQETSGKLWIQRPGKFRWNYLLPYQQQIISNGSKIWTYDIDLAQVTVRPMTKALGQTPASLIAGKGRIKDKFIIKHQGKIGSLDWTQLTSKDKESQFGKVRVGFENGQIKILEMIDNFGQTTRIVLSKVRQNKKINSKKFQFKAPEGVDVVGQ